MARRGVGDWTGIEALGTGSGALTSQSASDNASAILL